MTDRRSESNKQTSQGMPMAWVFAACLWAAGPLAGQVAADSVTCDACHRQQADELAASIHASIQCVECHGGSDRYDVPSERLQALQESKDADAAFEHGPSFRGAPSRSEVPERCGACHADVERMNPYGLRTDQLARYWTSGHGKALAQNGDEKVAVCSDCHGVHDVVSAREPASKTYPLNVPATCATCHADASLMSQYDLSVEIVEEYNQSVHGELLLVQKDTGSPNCATCHGNHSATPPGFASVGTVCGQCHLHAAKEFATSIHAEMDSFGGCVRCHGGGEDAHFHNIERITNPAGLMIQRYEHLMSSVAQPSAEQITETIHPDPKRIVMQTLSSCTDCHEDIEDDESLPKLLELLDTIADAERYYVGTAHRLNTVAKGVLLVENQRFKLEDARTYLIELAPLQHALDNNVVTEKVTELRTVCDEVNADLDGLESGLRLRYLALIPIWVFSVIFAGLLYVKYRQLEHQYVKP